MKNYTINDVAFSCFMTAVVVTVCIIASVAVNWPAGSYWDGYNDGQKNVYNTAAIVGHGGYYVDKNTGVIEFKWDGMGTCDSQWGTFKCK